MTVDSEPTTSAATQWNQGHAADPGPLSGVRVLDLTMNMSGPFATMLLADQGADVLKIEPPEGDPVRSVGTGRNGMTSYFANLNRNKRSVMVDLSTSAGVELILSMARGADVFVQNYRYGVIERLGLAADRMLGVNPRLVYASITGYGTTGPMAEMPAYDHVIQALSGMAEAQSELTGLPSMVVHGIVDKTTGYATAQAITAALYRRSATGAGVVLHVSMLDAAIELLWPDGMMNHTCLDDVDVSPPISRSFRVTPTLDGHLALVTVTTRQWNGLLRAILGREATDVGGIAERLRGGAAVMREARQAMAAMTTAEALEKLEAADVPCAPVLSRSDLTNHPQIQASGSTTVIDHQILGRIRQAMPAAQFDGRRAGLRPAPRLGAENARLEAAADPALLWDELPQSTESL